MEDIRKSKKIFIYKIIDLIPEIVLHIQYHRAFLSVCAYTLLVCITFDQTVELHLIVIFA